MRKINILVLLLATGTSCCCQEKIRVDLDGAASRTEPKVTSGKMMSGDNTNRNLIWRVDLSASATTFAGSLMLEIRIVNVSTMSRTLPTSQDGIRAIAECPDHTVLQGAYFLGSRADSKYLRQIGVFYGCEAVPATLLQLKPGEWVTFTTKLPANRLPKEIRAQIRFVHERYRRDSDGQNAEELDYDTVQFSSWVQVPGEAGAGN